MRQAIPVLAALAVLQVSAMAPQPAVAQSALTSMYVGARVPARVRLEPLGGDQPLSVSEQDLARGELQLERRYRVHSNDPRGYVLAVAPRLGVAESVEVSVEQSGGVLTDTGLEFLQRETGSSELRVHYRLRLREGLRAGSYAQPWQISVRPT